MNMFVKVRSSHHGWENITICEVAPTGKLNPHVSLIYAGDFDIQPTTQEKQSRFLLEQALPPHRMGELNKIFGESHDNSKSVQAQKSMFEKFVEIFDQIYVSNTNNTINFDGTNETPSSPIYFYHATRCESRFTAGEVLSNKYIDVDRPNLGGVEVYCSEDKKLCRIFFDKEDEKAVIKATEKAIMVLSQKAAIDLNDILKMPRPDGPNGVK